MHSCCHNRRSVLTTAPFKFGVLWALFFASFFFLDGVSQAGTEHMVIMWGGIYLLLSSGTLLFICVFHDWMHKKDRKNYVETTAWVFLSAACFALGLFTYLWPIWFPIAAGALLSARRSTQFYA